MNLTEYYIEKNASLRERLLKLFGSGVEGMYRPTRVPRSFKQSLTGMESGKRFPNKKKPVLTKKAETTFGDVEESLVGRGNVVPAKYVKKLQEIASETDEQRLKARKAVPAAAAIGSAIGAGIGLLTGKNIVKPILIGAGIGALAGLMSAASHEQDLIDGKLRNLKRNDQSVNTISLKSQDLSTKKRMARSMDDMAHSMWMNNLNNMRD